MPMWSSTCIPSGYSTRIGRGFEIHVTKTVLDEAQYYKSSGTKTRIHIRDRVTSDRRCDVGVYLQAVREEATEARLGIDPGELGSHRLPDEDDEGLVFCTCDRAAIKLLAFMNLEERSVSFEKVLRSTGFRRETSIPGIGRKRLLNVFGRGRH